MGRRPRHFNPIHAGAAFALDARYLTGYGNGANVTSWPSRSGATFDFTAGSNWPTFTASSSAAANQPGVNFVSGSSQRITASSVAVPSASDTFTYVEFATGGNGFVSFAQIGDLTRIGASFVQPVWNIIFHRGYFEWVSSAGAINTLDEGTYTNNVVAWGRQNGSAQDSGIGTTVQASRTSSGILRGDVTVNSATSDPRTGLHHASAAFSSALSNATLRRVVQSYGLSFKSAV